MSGESRSGCTIAWHQGPREELRDLFELAEDSQQQLDGYIGLGRVLVALDDAGDIVGHLQLVPTDLDEVAEIKSLAVRQGLQGRGIGRQLVARAVAECRANRIGTVRATTAAADIDNLRFYQRCGFRPVSIEPDAFTPATGYPADLSADGISVRDAVRFELVLA